VHFAVRQTDEPRHGEQLPRFGERAEGARCLARHLRYWIRTYKMGYYIRIFWAIRACGGNVEHQERNGTNALERKDIGLWKNSDKHFAERSGMGRRTGLVLLLQRTISIHDGCLAESWSRRRAANECTAQFEALDI
jgi:hypothetical protein